MKFLSLAALVFFLAGCAAMKPPQSKHINLIVGKQVGRLHLIIDGEDVDKSAQFQQAAFAGKQLQSDAKLAFMASSNTITQMKVYQGMRLLKECDETEVDKQHDKKTKKGSWVSMPDGSTVFVEGAGPSQEYLKKFSIVCPLSQLPDTLYVEMHDFDGMVAKYRVQPKGENHLVQEVALP